MTFFLPSFVSFLTIICFKTGSVYFNFILLLSEEYWFPNKGITDNITYDYKTQFLVFSQLSICMRKTVQVSTWLFFSYPVKNNIICSNEPFFLEQKGQNPLRHNFFLSFPLSCGRRESENWRKVVLCEYIV